MISHYCYILSCDVIVWFWYQDSDDQTVPHQLNWGMLRLLFTEKKILLWSFLKLKYFTEYTDIRHMTYFMGKISNY